MIFRTILVVFLSFLAPAAQACSTALLLLIDVSNSIDADEYRLQADGLADALSAPEIREELLAGQVALSVLQWSGERRQKVTQPWAQMFSEADIDAFAIRARTTPRAFVMSDTAPGNALDMGLNHLLSAPACDRQIIDVSSDGTANSGLDVREYTNLAQARGVTINGIAIEGMGLAITTYFHRTIITRDGFVITARGHQEYPEALRRKILREVSRILF